MYKRQVRNNFTLRVYLHKAKGVSLRNCKDEDAVAHHIPADDQTFAQELVLFHTYMHAIYTPKEEKEEEDEGECAEEDSSSGDDSGDEDYDDEASSRDDSDDEDDEDDKDASGASDSGSDSDED